MNMKTYLRCHKCKKYIHVGEGDYLYFGEALVRINLNAFLQTHKTHHLSFGNSKLNFEKHETILWTL